MTAKTSGFDSKIIKIEGCEADRMIESRAFFGWSYDQNASNWKPNNKLRKLHFLTKKKLVFIRPENIPYKDKLNELEEKYDKLESKHIVYVKADPILALGLFLLLIVPGVIYVIYKCSKKKSAKKLNRRLDEEMSSIAVEAERISSGHGEPILSGSNIPTSAPMIRANISENKSLKAPEVKSDTFKGQVLSHSESEKNN